LIKRYSRSWTGKPSNRSRRATQAVARIDQAFVLEHLGDAGDDRRCRVKDAAFLLVRRRQVMVDPG